MAVTFCSPIWPWTKSRTRQIIQKNYERVGTYLHLLILTLFIYKLGNLNWTIHIIYTQIDKYNLVYRCYVCGRVVDVAAGFTVIISVERYGREINDATHFEMPAFKHIFTKIYKCLVLGVKFALFIS